MIRLLLAGTCVAYLPAFASIIFVTTPGGLSPNDQFSWSQLGTDTTKIVNNFTAVSVNALNLTGSFGTSPNDGLVAVVCPPLSGTCSWTTSGSGINANDSLIWAFDNGTSTGTGPVSFAFASSVFGAGAWIQADTLGLYTVKLELFNGASSLGSSTTTSNSSGDPVFLGGLDSLLEVTKAVFSLTACAGCNGGTGDLGDFAIDTLQIREPVSGVPEPASFLLLGGGLVALAWRVRRKSLENRRGL